MSSFLGQNNPPKEGPNSNQNRGHQRVPGIDEGMQLPETHSKFAPAQGDVIFVVVRAVEVSVDRYHTVQGTVRPYLSLGKGNSQKYYSKVPWEGIC